MLIKNTHIVDNQSITPPPHSVIDRVSVLSVSFHSFPVATVAYSHLFLIQNFLRYTASLLFTTYYAGKSKSCKNVNEQTAMNVNGMQIKINKKPRKI